MENLCEKGIKKVNTPEKLMFKIIKLLKLIKESSSLPVYCVTITGLGRLLRNDI